MVRTAEPERPSSSRPPWARLASISVVGIVLRLGYDFLYQRHSQPVGDAFFYHFQANALAAGKPFVNPYDLVFFGRSLPAADHPPLFTLVLAAGSALGLKSFFSQILWSSGIGTAGVFVLGMAAREIAGDRACLMTAGIAAIYPVFLVDDGALMSESLVLLTTALVILTYYRLWRAPSGGRAAWLGLACAAGALTRPEFALVIPLMLIPFVVTKWRGVNFTRRLTITAVVLVVAVVSCVPWWAYNTTRFKDPVILSTQLGLTLADANCDATYYGPRIGYWDFTCPEKLGVHLRSNDDPSVQDYQLRHAALSYMSRHAGRVPLVMAARLGRELGVFSPLQQVDLEWQVLGRPRLPAFVGLGFYYAMAVLAVPGILLLRRRGASLVLFGAIFAETVLVCLATFGQTRYRTSLDAVLVVLAGVALAEVWQRVRARRGDRPAVTRPDASRSVGGHDFDATGWRLRSRH